jgi:alkylated DNA nucleotide flippase Atl1
MRWAGHVAHMGECGDLVGKPEGKRPLGKSMCRSEDNIKMDLQELVIRTGLSWLRIGTGGGNCECVNEPSGSIKCG